jgi:hypothetical protein
MHSPHRTHTAKKSFSFNAPGGLKTDAPADVIKGDNSTAAPAPAPAFKKVLLDSTIGSLFFINEIAPCGHLSTHSKQNVHSDFLMCALCIASMGQTRLQKVQCVQSSPICRFKIFKTEKMPNKAPKGQRTLHQNRSPNPATRATITINMKGIRACVINTKERVKITIGSEITNRLNPKSDDTITNTRK